MSIRVFTFSKVVMQILDIIADYGAYTREPSNIIIGRLPRAKQVWHMESCSVTQEDRHATKLATSMDVWQLPEHV